jgi:NAD(P)-dependent dehydrogenase (short-subunit alcohol dehydrogenase family)
MGTRLKDRVVLVTGAARGIGEAVSRLFVREGARVVVTDIADAGGEAVAADLGTRALYRRLDVRREADWENVIAEVLESFGRLDVLVNNAGITGFENEPVPHDPEHASLESWRAVHATNLDGVFLGCRHAIRAMRRTLHGSIVNISSRSGLVGIPAAAAYASSKAAVRNHTKTVALYCAEQGLGVRCNAVFPAAILTPMWEPMLGDGPDREERMRAITSDVPLGRFGTADEVAHAVLWLASDESSYVTGAEVVLDGGLLAGASARPQQ